MYNLSKYSDNYLKSSGRLWHYYRDEPNDILANSKLFKLKLNITELSTDDVPLNNFSNFSRTFEMSLTNCEISCQSNMVINMRYYQFIR